jgi:hypothetical protein
MQFRPDGPAVEGTWTRLAAALDRYRDWIGSHGSLPGVTISLPEETGDGHMQPIRTWTKEHGDQPAAEETPPIRDGQDNGNWPSARPFRASIQQGSDLRVAPEQSAARAEGIGQAPACKRARGC